MHNLYTIYYWHAYIALQCHIYIPNPSIWQANTIYYIELILTYKLLCIKLCKMNITVAILYSDVVLSTYTGFCALPPYLLITYLNGMMTEEPPLMGRSLLCL